MSNIHESVKIFASYAKKENHEVEKLVKLNPKFRRVKDQLITIVGRC